VPTRLHRGGRFRGWLGRRLGGDVDLGDRAWRRLLHLVGGLVVLYYVLPPGVFVVITTEEALLFGLAFVLALELLREVAGLEMPTVRAVERERVASFAYFAVALVVAVLLLPAPIGAAVVLGTALIDPLIGELRRSPRWRAAYPGLPVVAFAALAFGVFTVMSPWPFGERFLLALGAGFAAVACEYPKVRWVDDDLVMTLLPGLLLFAAAALFPP
jgi:hypothetical protein